jgi:hypothetical protein
VVPHASRGHITAHIADRVLFFESTGPFDGEIVEAVIRAYRPLLQRLADGGPFAHVSTFHRSMLATPDALDAFDQLLGEWRSSGLAPIANAYVAASDIEGRGLMMPIFASVFSGFSPFREFDRFEAAEAWVRQQLAAVD